MVNETAAAKLQFDDIVNFSKTKKPLDMINSIFNRTNKLVKESASAVKLVKSDQNQLDLLEKAKKGKGNEKTAAKRQIESMNLDMTAAKQSRSLNRIMQIDEPVIDSEYYVSVPTEVRQGEIRDTDRIISKGFLAIND